MGSRSQRSTRTESPPPRRSGRHRSKSRSRANTSEYGGEDYDTTSIRGNRKSRRGEDEFVEHDDFGMRNATSSSRSSRASRRAPIPSAPGLEDLNDGFMDDAASMAGAVPPSNAGSLYHAPSQLSHQPSMQFSAATPLSSAGQTRE